MDERVRLRERSTMLQEKVKGLEGKIKRDFLDRKPVVIEDAKLHYSEKLGACH